LAMTAEPSRTCWKSARWAPAFAYASSGKPASSPAPVSTVTIDFAESLFTSAGVKATRRSPGSRSRSSPSDTRAEDPVAVIHSLGWRRARRPAVKRLRRSTRRPRRFRGIGAGDVGERADRLFVRSGLCRRRRRSRWPRRSYCRRRPGRRRHSQPPRRFPFGQGALCLLRIP
jgi:hypothetical protein